MLIIRNNIIPFGRYKAMLFLGVLFAKTDLSDSDIRHEEIHSVQCLELLGVGFYLWYVVEWLVKLVMCRNTHIAYRNISFEREAYTHENDKGYMKIRKSFNFLKFLKS